MRSRLRVAELPLVPAEIAGLVLVILAGLILAGGLASLSGIGATTGRWLLAAGLLLLLGAALATLLIGSSWAAPAPTASRDGWVVAPVLPASSVMPQPADASQRVSADSELAPEPGVHPPVRPTSTSIPGAYLAAVEVPGGTPPPLWDDPGPPIAAALPFAALSTAVEPRSGATADTETSAVLEVELARLRARLREIELESPVRLGASPRLDVSGGVTTPLSPAAALDLARPAGSSSVGSRACASCGTPVASAGTPALCTSCGRLLCPECSSTAGVANGMLYCPDCRSKSASPGTPAISGGRAGIDPIASGAAARPLAPGPPDRR